MKAVLMLSVYLNVKKKTFEILFYDSKYSNEMIIDFLKYILICSLS